MSMSDDGQRRRQILPRSPTSGASARQAEESGEIRGSTSGQSSTPVSTSASGSGRSTVNSSSRTNIRSACLACRRRRNRCSGGHPCSRCRALETECVYDEAQDGRTRALRERGKEELELHRRIIDGVFRAIREGNQQRLFDLIRNNASLETIATAIEESNFEKQSETPPEQAEGSSTINSWVYPRSATMSGQPTEPHAADQLSGQPTEPHAEDQLSGYHTNMADHSSLTSGSSHIQTLGAGVTLTEIRHMLQPLHNEDHSTLRDLSSMYINFKVAVAQMIKRGIPIDNVLGSPGALCVFRSHPEKSALDVSSWATIVVKDIQEVDFLFKLAWLCYITRFLTWAIHPSLENFDRVPLAMKPTTMQLTVAHPAVIDLVPLPPMREQMIQNFRDFRLALRTAGAGVYWTEPIEEAMITDPITGDITVTAKFEQCINDTSNFYFGRSILNTFPELAGEIEIAEVDQVMGVLSDGSPAASLMDE